MPSQGVDPTHPLASCLNTQFSERAAFLRHVGAVKGTTDKLDLVERLCKDQRVLDVGCIDHSLDVVDALGGDWVHQRIVAVAKETVGIDILREEAATLRERGYNIVEADAQTFDLHDTFDVVVAADIIEHVPSPGAMLESIAQHCHQNTLVLITTPNPVSFLRFTKAALRNQVSIKSDHVAWFDPLALWQMAERTGFTVVGFRWIRTRFSDFAIQRLSRRMASYAHRLATWMRPVLNADFAIILQLDQDKRT